MPTSGNSPDKHIDIKFQDGPRKVRGVNGCLVEDVLDILIKRIQMYQDSGFPCRENAEALRHLQASLAWLDERTSARMKQGVEGTDVAHI